MRVNKTPRDAGIDSCVREIQAIGRDVGLDFFNRMLIVYRDLDNNLIASCSVNELKEMIAEKDFPTTTPIFNNSLQTLGQLRQEWEIPADNSWISRYFSTVGA